MRAASAPTPRTLWPGVRGGSLSIPADSPESLDGGDPRPVLVGLESIEDEVGSVFEAEELAGVAELVGL